MDSHGMVIRADAKAMGAVTALDTRVSARWTPSKASARIFDGKPFTGTSECISYDAAGNATIFTQARKRNRVPNRYNASTGRPKPRKMAWDLPAIGNVE